MASVVVYVVNHKGQRVNKLDNPAISFDGSRLSGQMVGASIGGQRGMLTPVKQGAVNQYRVFVPL